MYPLFHEFNYLYVHNEICVVLLRDAVICAIKPIDDIEQRRRAMQPVGLT